MSAQNEAPSVELPRYRCHKEVHALKIAAIEPRTPTIDELERLLAGTPADGDGIGGWITPENTDYARFSVTTEYMRKHNPKPGGYYVLYRDGYASFSPAEAFEEGYTLITE